MAQIAANKNTNRARAILVRMKSWTIGVVVLALAGLEPGVGLVDNVNATLATDNLVVTMALHQTLEGIADFHGLHL